MRVPGKAAGPVQVAVGLIRDARGRILISRRAADAHQGGLWEFPGGKLEPDEPIRSGLRRELREELGITPNRMLPLLRIPFHYPDKHVLLDVWEVAGFNGEPRGREGQPLRWVEPDRLDDYRFPEANAPIIKAARLPEHYLITPAPGTDTAAFLAKLEARLAAGIRLVQLRAHGLSEGAYLGLARACLARCRHHGAELLLNGPPAVATRIGAGLHLTAARLADLPSRPALAPGRLLASSCHTEAELARAVSIGVDFCVLGPVKPTTTHPDAKPLGFDGFAAMVRDVPLPIYALGGMQSADLVPARERRAQGIAAIRGLWITDRWPDQSSP